MRSAQHKLRPGKDRTALLQFLERLKKLATKRNDIVHAVYLMVYERKKTDLPVQAPTSYETAINLKTTNTLGLAASPGPLVAADEVIE